MSEPLSGLSLAKQSSRLKVAVGGALEATKRYPQYKFERFMEALHASGFDVQEIPVQVEPATDP